MRYLQLAHNQWDAATKTSRPRVLYSFGRADQLDRAMIERLVASLSRLLDPAAALRATASAELRFVESRQFGGPWLLDQLWRRLGITEAWPPQKQLTGGGGRAGPTATGGGLVFVGALVPDADMRGELRRDRAVLIAMPAAGQGQQGQMQAFQALNRARSRSTHRGRSGRDSVRSVRAGWRSSSAWYAAWS